MEHEIKDKVYREDAIHIIDEYLEEYSDIDANGLHNQKWCAMMEAKDVIISLQSAQLYGHWITELGTKAVCSTCGTRSLDAMMGIANYCPNCGAIMLDNIKTHTTRRTEK